MDIDYDIAVVGGGAGGLSAALVLTRARRRVVVMDAGQPRNAPAAHLHGFLTRDGTAPAELLALGESEVASYGGDRLTDRVHDITRESERFCLTLSGGRTVTTRRVLVATGLTDQLPDIPGLGERWGRDVLHCPYCHGHEVADHALGVINTGPTAAHQATTIRAWSKDVTLFTTDAALGNGERTHLERLGIPVVTTPVRRLVTDDDRLTGVMLADGVDVPLTAVFVSPTPVPNDELLRRLGAATDVGPLGRFVITDTVGRTSVEGVRAVGNVTDPRAQLITAAGDGCRTAIDLNGELIEEDARRSAAWSAA